MNTETLIRLMLRRLYGEASPEENKMLDKWLSEDESHRDLYAHLNDRKYLSREYEKWQAIDSDRPLKAMQSRVLKKNKSFGHVAVTLVGMAASFAVAALLFRGSEQTQETTAPVDYFETIVPGHTFATLTQADGETLQLTSEDAVPSRSFRNSVQVDSRDDTVSVETQLAELSKVSLNVPRGGEFHIILEDSTEVWLNAESSLEYPEAFSKTERVVEVKGEAYFKVAKDADRPFLVKSYGQTVRVYGTEFEVASYPEDEYVYTTLVQGKVGIMPDINSSSSLFLSPDSQAVFSKTDATTTVKQVNAKLVTSWKDGLFVFEDQTLAQIMTQLSRWYDFDFRFADENAASIQFKGRMPRYGKFVDLLKILQMSGGIRFSTEGECVIISSYTD